MGSASASPGRSCINQGGVVLHPGLCILDMKTRNMPECHYNHSETDEQTKRLRTPPPPPIQPFPPFPQLPPPNSLFRSPAQTTQAHRSVRTTKTPTPAHMTAPRAPNGPSGRSGQGREGGTRGKKTSYARLGGLAAQQVRQRGAADCASPAFPRDWGASTGAPCQCPLVL